MKLGFGNLHVTADMVAFDKDGTLIAFHDLWHAWMDRFIQAIDEQVPLSDALHKAFALILGWDASSGVWDPLGPATLASTQEAALLAASVLYGYASLDWPKAQAVVRYAYDNIWDHLPVEDLIRPTGDVTSLLGSLRAEGIHTALVTADDRLPTIDTLERFGWLELFDVIMCGDDGLPQKPNPELLLETCRRIGVSPERTIMVGDTVADLAMARGAGAAFAVAVLGGSMPVELLAPHADVVLSSIDDIVIIREE